MNQVRAVANRAKYVCKCTEDVNEVILFGNNELNRVARFKEIQTKFGLAPGVWLSKKQMKILHHVEHMQLL